MKHISTFVDAFRNIGIRSQNKPYFKLRSTRVTLLDFSLTLGPPHPLYHKLN